MSIYSLLSNTSQSLSTELNKKINIRNNKHRELMKLDDEINSLVIDLNNTKEKENEIQKEIQKEKENKVIEKINPIAFLGYHYEDAYAINNRIPTPTINNWIPLNR